MTTDGRPVWDDGVWPAVPSLVGEATADVCVIGLGGSGLTAIQELQQHGATVIGVDAGPVGGGAAGRNGGFLLAGLAEAHHVVSRRVGRERATLLYRRTQEEIRRIVAATPDAVRISGSLRIERSPEGLADCAEQARVMSDDGLAVEEYEGPEGTGLLFPGDAVVQPLRRCRSLAEQVLSHGSRLYESTRVVDIAPGVVTTERGRIRCGAVVVTVDGNLDLLLPEVPVHPVRLQMLATAPTQEITVPRPVYLRGGMEYWQQLPDGRITLGGFRDVGGDAEQTRDSSPSAAVQQALESFLREDLGVQAEITHRWAATVGYTHDYLPFVGEVRPRVWAAGGYCGTGNVVGALCGRQLAADALGITASYWS